MTKMSQPYGMEKPALPDRIRQFFAESDSHAAVSDQPQADAYIAFVIVMLGLMAFAIWSQPTWVLGGEMWAEMATNYYSHSVSDSWMEKLFATDSGYWPAPQRLIALLVWASGVPAQWIPHIYNVAALVLGTTLATAFCLPWFRRLIASDALRVMVCLVVFLLVDFESRGFINFTYYAGFFVAVFAATAILRSKDDLPWWSLFVPVLLITKPSVLVTVPLLLVWGIVSTGRSRLVAAIAIGCAFIQVAFLVVSMNSGVFLQKSNDSFWEKLHASARYSLGVLGRYLVGAYEHVSPSAYMLVGLAVLVVATLVAIVRKGAASMLILTGLLLIVGNQSLNSFAISDHWRPDMSGLAKFTFFRYTLVSFWGSLLLGCGLLCASSTGRWNTRLGQSVSCAILMGWLIGAGWLKWIPVVNADPTSPDLYNSYWQQLASRLDRKEPTCIPINPYGWYAGFNCGLLNKQRYRDSLVGHVRTHEVVLDKISPEMMGHRISGFTLLVRPSHEIAHDLRASGIITMKDGQEVSVTTNRYLDQSGGLLYFTMPDLQIEADQISLVRLSFNVMVDISVAAVDRENIEIAMMWFGN